MLKLSHTIIFSEGVKKVRKLWFWTNLFIGSKHGDTGKELMKSMQLRSCQKLISHYVLWDMESVCTNSFLVWPISILALHEYFTLSKLYLNTLSKLFCNGIILLLFRSGGLDLPISGDLFEAIQEASMEFRIADETFQTVNTSMLFVRCYFWLCHFI